MPSSDEAYYRAAYNACAKQLRARAARKQRREKAQRA